MADPQIIAHRGGNKNWPENTLCAFENALKAHVDRIELDVQVTSDGVPVVYHPPDLAVWTSASGKVSDKTVAEVTTLDASAKYQGPKPTQCRAADLRIPRLVDVLRRIPNIPIVLDLKSLPAEPLIAAILKHVPASEWSRLTVYSTQREHTAAFAKAKSDVVVFEDRADTYQRLVTINGATKSCAVPHAARWVGFELTREVEICEQFTLGRNCTKTPLQFWTPESVECTRRVTGGKLVFFGVNTPEDYARARALGADAVFTDDPLKLLPLKK